MMLKASKSKLAKALKKYVLSKTYKSNQLFHVLNGGSVLHKVKWLSNNSYQSIADQYSKYIKQKYGKACLVFDDYDNGLYIKDHETGKMNPFVSLYDLQMTPKCSQEIFLKNNRNKVQFISILSEELRKEGHDIRNSTGYADTNCLSSIRVCSR